MTQIQATKMKQEEKEEKDLLRSLAGREEGRGARLPPGRRCCHLEETVAQADVGKAQAVGAQE